MRALLVYYSFTEQAKIATTLAVEELSKLGIETVSTRIDFAERHQRLRRPLPFSEQVRWGNMAEKRQTLPVVVDRPDALKQRYDLVLLFSNTWKFHPSVPVQSFLVSPAAAAVLRDTPFAVVVVCRGFWRKNLRIVREMAEKLGGRFIDGQGFGFDGSWLASTVQSVRYVASIGPAQRRWGLLPIPPYGLSPKAQIQLREFIQTIGKRAAQLTSSNPQTKP